MLGVDYDSALFDGENLFKNNRELNRDNIISEGGHTARKRAIRSDTYKYIKRIEDSKCTYCTKYHTGNIELFNISGDKGENNNIEQSNPDLVDELDSRIDSRLQKIPSPTKAGISFDENEEVMEHLEDMGYI
ncbi:MAG: hypothetical protein ABEI13_02405 [Candidatus Paceibacteria bacterium]